MYGDAARTLVSLPAGLGTGAMLLALVAEWPAVPDARAQPDVEPDVLDEPVIEFENNELPPADHRLAPSLFYGAEIELELESELNYDLDAGEDDNLVSLEPFFKLALAYIPSPRLDAVVSFELAREFLLNRPRDEPAPPTRLELKEAYVTFRDLTDGLALKLGRQSFDDEREWLYDEELDAVRLFYGLEHWGLEASVSREELFDKDLLDDQKEDRINNYFLLGRYMPDDDVIFEGYAFLRDDVEPDGGQLIFLGLRSFGELLGDVRHWVELAAVTGKAERNDDLGRRPDLLGYGFDVGATYVLDAPLEPSLTLGFAYGSGDSDLDDRTDHNFRQTGLQDNSDAFNGIAGFKYYGEVFDPELSNLSILTAGVGIRPTERSSIDVIFHRYRQNKAVDEIRDSNLDEDPNGDSRALGSAIDLVVGYEPLDNLALEAIVGYFGSGNAFEEDDNAYFVGFESILTF
jgi:alginate production protein